MALLLSPPSPGANIETQSILVALSLPGYGVSSSFLCDKCLPLCILGACISPKPMDPSDDTQKTPKSRDNVNISPF
jgi:hypothetical protein